MTEIEKAFEEWYLSSLQADKTRSRPRDYYYRPQISKRAWEAAIAWAEEHMNWGQAVRND